MTTQPETLRLAAELDALLGYRGINADVGKAAAELRRLSIENDALGLHLSERMKDLARAEAQRDALLEALRDLMARLDPYDYPDEQNFARAAIKAVEEEKT